MIEENNKPKQLDEAQRERVASGYDLIPGRIRKFLRLYPDVDKELLYDLAVDGLIDAGFTFDESKGTQFRTFAYGCISRRLYNALQRAKSKQKTEEKSRTELLQRRETRSYLDVYRLPEQHDDGSRKPERRSTAEPIVDPVDLSPGPDAIVADREELDLFLATLTE